MNQKTPRIITPHRLNKWILSEAPKPALVDVREANELNIAPFPLPVIHLPLSKADEWANTITRKLSKEQPVVAICHAGIRSWNFGIWLLEQKMDFEVWNLEGGIDAWSVEIDDAVPRY